LASTPEAIRPPPNNNQYNVLDSQSTDGTSFSYDKDGNKYDSGSYKTEAVGIDVYGTVRISETNGTSTRGETVVGGIQDRSYLRHSWRPDRIRDKRHL